MRIYQAGPLFTEAEQHWHRELKKKLEEAGYEPLWPFELFSQEDAQAWGRDAAREIMETDRNALESCGMVLALLDGPQVDDGTAWEIGYAFARGIPVVGVRTDFRKAGETAFARVNAMIEGSCARMVRSMDEAVACVREMCGDKA